MDSEKRVHFQPQKVTEIGVFSRLKINEKGSFSKLENTDENTSVPVRVGRGRGGGGGGGGGERVLTLWARTLCSCDPTSPGVALITQVTPA